MITDLLLLLVLIVLNGIFAMSEIAIVSSRRARLVQMAETGNSGVLVRVNSRRGAARVKGRSLFVDRSGTLVPYSPSKPLTGAARSV